MIAKISFLFKRFAWKTAKKRSQRIQSVLWEFELFQSASSVRFLLLLDLWNLPFLLRMNNVWSIGSKQTCVAGLSGCLGCPHVKGMTEGAWLGDARTSSRSSSLPSLGSPWKMTMVAMRLESISICM